MIWKIKARYREKVWGSKTLLTTLGFPNNRNQQVGEILLLSALPNEESMLVCDDPRFCGSLTSIFNHNKHLFFAHKYKTFPLLVKILTPARDLSVQVHPTDEYAWQHERQQFGKEESWVVLACKPQQKIVYGHKAESLVDFNKCIKNEQEWKSLLNYLPIFVGTIVNIPPGTVHAVLGGTIVYEVQQNCDLTYRLYDYNRQSINGLKRPLHIKKALANIYVPQRLIANKKIVFSINELSIQLKNTHYVLYSLNIVKTFSLLVTNNALFGIVVAGACSINKISIATNESFILARSTNESYKFCGNANIIIITVAET